MCEELLAAGKTPIVCGGTGFYIQSLLFCRSNGNIGADAVCRARYEEIVRIEGKEGLYARLCAVDPESAAILHPNDVKRVSRALEIYDLTGKKKSAQRDGFMPRFSYVAVAFDYAREELYARIDARVDEMLRLGLVDEVRALRDAGVPDYAQSMQGIGYKEVLNYLNGEVSFSTMSDIIKKNTRNYAKRQITFFKKFPGIVWLDPLNKYNAEIVQEQMNHG